MGIRAPVQTSLTEALEEAHGLQAPRWTMKQRQEKLFEELDLSGLESWPPKLVDSTSLSLAEYHNVFPLEPSKLGCTLQLNMWLNLLMIPHSKNTLSGFHHY